jgi:hypothetical protein
LPLAADATQYCSDASLLPIVNRPSDAWSPCVVGDDGVLLESGYYQNASSVGGSAIAEYPDAELRVGFARALEVMLDPETQIDRSGNHGKGFFTTSDPGLGLKWQLADQPNGAYDFGAEVNPPETAASFPWQPKYRFGLDSSERVTKRWRTDLGLNLVDDGRIDDGRLHAGPALDGRARPRRIRRLALLRRTERSVERRTLVARPILRSSRLATSAFAAHPRRRRGGPNVQHVRPHPPALYRRRPKPRILALTNLGQQIG